MNHQYSSWSRATGGDGGHGRGRVNKHQVTAFLSFHLPTNSVLLPPPQYSSQGQPKAQPMMHSWD